MKITNSDSMSIVEEFDQKITKELRKDLLMRWAPVVVLFVLIFLFTILAPKSFPTFTNIVNLLNQLSITLIIAVGLTFVSLIGSVNLSVDGVVGLTASILSVLVLNSNNQNNFGLLGVLIAIGIGALAGLLSGLIHVKLKISSFMVTFGMLAVTKGFAIMSYGGRFAEIEDPFLTLIPNNNFLGIPLITWFALILLAVAYIIQERTSFGRYMYAVGTNEALPRMTGINVDKVKVQAFIWSGFCLGLAGVLGALRLGRGEVDVGTGNFFPAQAAVAIGGTSLSGGKGGVINTLVGTLIITVVSNGLLLLGVNIYIRSGVEGLIILIAIALSVSRSKRIITK